MSAFFSKIGSFFASIFTAISPAFSAISAWLPSLPSTGLLLVGIAIGYIAHPILKLAVDVVRLLLKI